MDIELVVLIDLIQVIIVQEGDDSDRIALMNLDKVEEILENIISNLMVNCEGCDSFRKSTAEIGEKKLRNNKGANRQGGRNKMNNKFVEIDFKISDEFNALPFEERKKIRRFTEAQRLRSFEQIKYSEKSQKDTTRNNSMGTKYI